jgi:hypothetical protein
MVPEHNNLDITIIVLMFNSWKFLLSMRTSNKKNINFTLSAYAAYAQPIAKTVATYTSAPAYSNYGYEHGSSEQNIVRSAHGTVSHISKAVDGPHSSVRKYDTRVVNDAPSYKVAAVASPVYHQQAVYAHQPTVYASHAPAVTYSQPAVHTYQAPVVTKTVAAPIATYTSHAAPVATYAHSAPVYAQSAPVVKSAIQYSPAVAVSHASFEGLGAQYAW